MSAGRYVAPQRYLGQWWPIQGPQSPSFFFSFVSLPPEISPFQGRWIEPSFIGCPIWASPSATELELCGCLEKIAERRGRSRSQCLSAAFFSCFVCFFFAGNSILDIRRWVIAPNPSRQQKLQSFFFTEIKKEVFLFHSANCSATLRHQHISSIRMRRCNLCRSNPLVTPLICIILPVRLLQTSSKGFLHPFLWTWDAVQENSLVIVMEAFHSSSGFCCHDRWFY